MIWKNISGYENKYMVSDTGLIKRLAYSYTDSWGTGRHRERPEVVFKPKALSNSGYIMVDLNCKGKRKRVYLHRILAEAFISNPNNLPCVNHKDENKLNNSLDNLEWCDWTYNNRYGTSRNRMVKTRRLNGTYENVSQETRNKISNALKGKKKSVEHRKNISLGKRKYKNTCKGD